MESEVHQPVGNPHMDEPSGNNNPRGHGNAVPGRTRGRGRGSVEDTIPARGTHRGRGQNPRTPRGGNSAGVRGDREAAVENVASPQKNNIGGGGGRGKRGRGSGPGTRSARGVPQPSSRGAGIGGQRNQIPRTSIQSTLSNNINAFSAFNQRASSELSAAQILEFLQEGLLAVTASIESRDTFFKNLATESGLTRVRQIVETDFSPFYSVRNPMFDPHCMLFLQIISRKDIGDSLVLETAVGTIFNFIYGIEGSRGIAFFRKIASCLKQMKSEVEVSRFEEGMLLTTMVLLRTFKSNSAAAVNTDFKGIIEQLCACYNAEDVNRGLASLELRSIHDNMLKIRDRLSTGDSISISHVAGTRTNNSSQQQLRKHQLPKVDVDLPGKLSQFGPRHDNDHALISDIRILPTLSEIISDQREDFLPTRHHPNSPSKHHETGILRLLDSQFRLLREDTSGILRNSVRFILKNWETLVHDPDWKAKRKILRNGSPTPVRIYFDAEIQGIRAHPIKGMEIDVEFDQVRGARNSNPMKRKQWWRESRSLKEGGAILALIDGEEEENLSVIFFLVLRREMWASGNHEQQSPSGKKTIRDLTSDASRAMITLRLANPAYMTDLSNLLNLTSNNKRGSPSSRPLILVEFPALLHNSFEGVLRCLQSLHKDPALPFTSLLVPRLKDDTLSQEQENTYHGGNIVVPPPAYLLGKANINLSCLPIPENANQDDTTTPISFSLSHDPHSFSTQLSQITTLDTGQTHALVSALRHEVALIQGPPGTGKSYVGIQIARCLLKNRDLLDLGPILCVCYTNHALDQFLHELLNSGVTSLLRFGSRSQSPILEAHSFETHQKNKKVPHLKGGWGKKIADCRAVLDELSVKVQEVCRQAEEGGVIVLKKFLKKRFSAKAESMFMNLSGGVGADVDVEGKENAVLEAWLSGDAPGDWTSGEIERSIDQLLLVDIWTLTKFERARLHQYWHCSAFSELSQELQLLMQKHSEAKQLYTSLFNAAPIHFISQFHIVGVTTTSLANNYDLLRALPAKVLICEEAGEVLEAHALTALLPSIQHAILIGDHLQLRPRISNLKLSMEYNHAGPTHNLDESLFERLANSRLGNLNMDEGSEVGGRESKFPIAQLDHQRRMHPSISNLVRETLYPRLQDHPHMSSYPEVPGMRRRLFWLDHRNFEDADNPDEPMQSKTNMWEAKMVTALVRHLCRQGKYKPGEIAVLTPYVGQLRLLRDMLGKIVELIIGERDLEDLDAPEMEVGGDNSRSRRERPQQKQQQQMVGKGTLLDELRMASVDNFQGEEATVVIVSLVRSNMARNCGFLKTPNRINVLLSRAKHGMYIIGDANTSSGVPMWSSVIKLLEKNGNIGQKLELSCSRHPNKKVYVSSPDDFAIHAPEGGCSEKCDIRSNCGHSCPVKCHSKTLHEAVKCMELCTKERMCGHLCSKRCSALCGECSEKVKNVLLPCGHTAKEVECQQMKSLNSVKCYQHVTREIPGCGHNLTVPCHESSNEMICSKLCHSDLPCGHQCRKPCWACRQSGDHGSCNMPCGRPFTTCSHACSLPCHPNNQCFPCNRPCEIRCKHSKCPKACNEPCPPCAEQCGWSCDHRRDHCNMPCAVPCDIIPCNRRCEKKLVPCGHQCPGVCGELCPDSKVCLICNPSMAERVVDWFEFDKYGDIDIDKSPLIFLSCGHFYTLSSLDGVMGLAQHYTIDPQTDKIVGPKLSPRIVTSGSAPKGCPECRMPLRDIDRYNRIVKKAMLDEATRRFVSHSNTRCAELVEEIRQRETNIENERREFIREWSRSLCESKDADQVKDSLRKYQEKGIRLLSQINKFIKAVGKTEQPFGRVNSIFAAAVSRQQNIAPNAFVFDESIIQTGFQFRGESFSLRLNWAILWDLDTIYSNETIDSRIRSGLRNTVANRVKGLIEKCLSLVNSSRDVKLPQQEAEGQIFFALFSMLSLSNSKAQDKTSDVAVEDSTRAQAKKSLEECETLCSQFPGTLAYLKDDIEKAKRLVNGGTFYSFVTTEEKREVYRAMAEQFSGTGHWYYCLNNHPFTVGECGMPMEEARCPQCGEPVGGNDHISVEGVRRAEDLENEFAGV